VGVAASGGAGVKSLARSLHRASCEAGGSWPAAASAASPVAASASPGASASEAFAGGLRRGALGWASTRASSEASSGRAAAAAGVESFEAAAGIGRCSRRTEGGSDRVGVGRRRTAAAQEGSASAEGGIGSQSPWPCTSASAAPAASAFLALAPEIF
jgi:hypothetical protein